MSRLFRVGAPNIIRGGRSRELLVPFDALRVEGHVTVDLIHARSGLVKQHLEFRNLVVDAGLDSLGAGTRTLSNFLSGGWMAVGTSSTAPAVSQTGLVAETGVRTNSNGAIADVIGSGASFAYWYIRITRVWTEPQSNGNLTEFGLFNASAAGTMLARQLFKDAGGNPTTVVKTSADQLRITYEFRMYPPTVDATGSTTISGTSYGWTARAVNVNQDVAWGQFGASGLLVTMGSTTPPGAQASNATAIGTLTTGPTGATAGANQSSAVVSPYTTGSFLREITFVWDPGAANFTGGSGGVSAFTFQPWGTANAFTHQAFVTPFFAKDSTKRLTLVWRFPWARFP